jgi:glycosyltransferase involved in cell wall biosynthesis
VTGTLAADGATRQLCELACRLDRSRHRVHLYALSEEVEPYGSHLRANDVAVTSFARRHSWETGRLLALARALRDDGIDLVHAARPAGALYGALAARLAGVATVIAVAREGERLPLGISRYLLGDVYRRATAVVVNSRAYATLLATTFSLRRERTRVVYDGVDVARFPVPGRLEGLRERVRPGTPVIGGFGSPAMLELFLAAAARVLARDQQVRFLWCGGGGDRDEHERLVAVRGVPVALRCGIEELAGELPRLTVLWVLGAADDGARAVALEAMAAARPVVVVRGGGLEELVADDITGFVVEPQDVDALADRGIALLHHGARRREVGHAARVRVEREFAIPRTVQAMATLYEEAMLGWLAMPGQATGDGVADAVPGCSS